MKIEALIYVPSDTPFAMVAATTKVAGVPTIVRGILTLAKSGVRGIAVLAASAQKQKIEKFLSRWANKITANITIFTYDEPYCVGSETIAKLTENLDNNFLIINGNLLFEHELIDTIKLFAVRGREIIACYDGAHPIPIIKVTRSLFADLKAFCAGAPRSIEHCIKTLMETGNIRTVQKHSSTFLLRRPRERIVAEKFLAEAIRHKTSAPIARIINKRISLPISLILSRLWISPNAITGFNIILGLFSGVFAADGHRYNIILIGAVLFQMASIIDGCDGEVAKLTFRQTKFGQLMDTVSDNLSLTSFMIGLIAGYWRHTHSYVAFIVGAIMILATAVTFFWMIRYLKLNTSSASLVTFDEEYLQKLSGEPKWFEIFIKYGKYTLKKDVFSFMFLVFAIFGVLYWWLFIAAFGTTLAAITLSYLNLRQSAPSLCKGRSILTYENN